MPVHCVNLTTALNKLVLVVDSWTRVTPKPTLQTDQTENKSIVLSTR